jgi:hypothetical protein
LAISPLLSPITLSAITFNSSSVRPAKATGQVHGGTADLSRFIVAVGGNACSTGYSRRNPKGSTHCYYVKNTAQLPRVAANTMVRRMSGGTQAHLIRASDLRYYVVKFINNPQHRRVLVNELLSSLLLNHLGLPTPPVALVSLDPQFIHENSDVHIQGKDDRLPASAGQHFGSSYPGSPLADAVYEFLPDVLLTRVVNLSAFVGMLVFDKWIGNTDSRQCVFFRSAAFLPDHTSSEPQTFGVQFIDNGGAFDGPAWGFADSPLRGPYWRPCMYRDLCHWADLESSIDQIKNVSENVITSAVQQLPMEWFENDERELQRLVEQLLKRRTKIPELISETIRNCPASFLKWQN